MLPNGKVLVAGGYDNSGYLSSAELYDPATGTWTTTGSLNTGALCSHGDVAAQWKVLVAGGLNGNPLSSAELYDPATGTWTTTGALNRALWPHGDVAAQRQGAGRGGLHRLSGYLTSSAELYDPASGTWTTPAR